MFDPAVAAILDHHEARSGHSMMRAAARRAQELGYALVPPAKGDGKYLRLTLSPPGGIPVTLYLEGSRVSAGAKHLRAFAASLPGAVVAEHDVRFPLGTVEISVLEAAFAHSIAVPGRQDGSSQPRSRGAAASSPARTPRAAGPPSGPRTAAGSVPPPRTAPRSASASARGARPARPAATGSATPRVDAGALRSSRIMLAAAAALLLLVAVLLVGAHGVLIVGGLAGVGLGVAALVRGRVGWAHIGSRGLASAVAAGGLALCIAGGALTPTQPATQSNTTAPSGTGDRAAGPSSAELGIAAAEAALARTETQEAAVAPDVLVTNPASGALTDDAAVAVVAGAAPTTALAALAAVEVKGRAPRTGYDRDLFGSGWGDPDRNGCDTRNDVLARDLTAEVFKPGTRDCVVLSGALADPYSGGAIAFRRGQTTSDDVQIDHVVAVSDAWQKGAQGWDAGRRVAFYNDPLNLLAVDGPLNLQKGDGDAATWLPPNRSYRCPYVARQIAVKVSYGLWMTQAEKTAMATVLSACPGEPLPGGVVAQLPERAAEPAPAAAAVPPPVPAPAPAAAPAPAPAAAPAPAPAVVVPAPAPAPPVVAPAPPPAPVPAPPPAPAPGVYYENCDAVRAAGAAPIHPGDAGWQDKFDRDKDGVGCE